MAHAMDHAPERLIDYFCVVGVEDDSDFIGHDMGQLTVAKVLARWPLQDHADSPIPEMVPLFCFPGGVDVRHREKSERRPVVFTFALTNVSGRRSYGNALVFYEARRRVHSAAQHDESDGVLQDGPQEASEDEEHVHVPKVLCILSHWPFHPVFKLFLRHLLVNFVRPARGDEDFVADRAIFDVAEDPETWLAVAPPGAGATARSRSVTAAEVGAVHGASDGASDADGTVVRESQVADSGGGAAGSWVCRACHMKNQSSSRYCVYCGTKSPVDPAQSTAAAGGVPAMPVLAGGESVPRDIDVELAVQMEVGARPPADSFALSDDGLEGSGELAELALATEATRHTRTEAATSTLRASDARGGRAAVRNGAEAGAGDRPAEGRVERVSSSVGGLFVRAQRSFSHTNKTVDDAEDEKGSGKGTTDGANEGGALESVAAEEGKLTGLPLEAHVKRFVDGVPLPAPGESVAAQIFDKDVNYVRQPLATLPHVDDDSIGLLFKCLSSQNVLHAVRCLLLEQRVLIRSVNLGSLAPCAEALLALLFPHHWEHVYVPLLPVQLMEYVQAPMPFLIGIEARNFADELAQYDAVGDSSLDDALRSTVVIDLDIDQVFLPPSYVVGSGATVQELPCLPPIVEARLVQSMERIVMPLVIRSNLMNGVEEQAMGTTAAQQWRHTLRQHTSTSKAGPRSINVARQTAPTPKSRSASMRSVQSASEPNSPLVPDDDRSLGRPAPALSQKRASVWDLAGDTITTLAQAQANPRHASHPDADVPSGGGAAEEEEEVVEEEEEDCEGEDHVSPLPGHSRVSDGESALDFSAAFGATMSAHGRGRRFSALKISDGATADNGRDKNHVVIAGTSLHFVEYDLLFGDGPIGIVFESTHVHLMQHGAVCGVRQRSFDSSAVVKDFAKASTATPAQGYAQTGRLQVGAHLVAVNGGLTTGTKFKDTMDLIRRLPRPLTLRFRFQPTAATQAAAATSTSPGAVQASSGEASEDVPAARRALSVRVPMEVSEDDVVSWVDEVRCAFAEMFAGMYSGYRHFLRVERHHWASPTLKRAESSPAGPRMLAGRRSIFSMSVSLSDSKLLVASAHDADEMDGHISQPHFDRRAFLDGNPPAARPFMQVFLGTQAFSAFLADVAISATQAQPDPEIDLFDRCVVLQEEFDQRDARSSSSLQSVVARWSGNAVGGGNFDGVWRLLRRRKQGDQAREKHEVATQRQNEQRCLAAANPPARPSSPRYFQGTGFPAFRFEDESESATATGLLEQTDASVRPAPAATMLLSPSAAVAADRGNGTEEKFAKEANTPLVIRVGHSTAMRGVDRQTRATRRGSLAMQMAEEALAQLPSSSSCPPSECGSDDENVDALVQSAIKMFHGRQDDSTENAGSGDSEDQQPTHTTRARSQSDMHFVSTEVRRARRSRSRGGSSVGERPASFNVQWSLSGRRRPRRHRVSLSGGFWKEKNDGEASSAAPSTSPRSSPRSDTAAPASPHADVVGARARAFSELPPVMVRAYASMQNLNDLSTATDAPVSNAAAKKFSYKRSPVMPRRRMSKSFDEASMSLYRMEGAAAPETQCTPLRAGDQSDPPAIGQNEFKGELVAARSTTPPQQAASTASADLDIVLAPVARDTAIDLSRPHTQASHPFGHQLLDVLPPELSPEQYLRLLSECQLAEEPLDIVDQPNVRSKRMSFFRGKADSTKLSFRTVANSIRFIQRVQGPTSPLSATSSASKAQAPASAGKRKASLFSWSK